MLQRLWEHLVVKHGGIITDSFDLQVSVCVVGVCKRWRERVGGECGFVGWEAKREEKKEQDRERERWRGMRT